MASSPNQSPPGKQFELRVTASDLEFDRLLAELTLPATRTRLPGFLYLFSEKTLMHTVTDRDIDGHSNTEARFRGMQMRVTNHNRTRFSLDAEVEKERQKTGNKELRVHFGLHLGAQAASEIVIPPFFDDEDKGKDSIPFYYTIPDPVHARTMEKAYKRLGEYLGENPRGIVDELTLVQTALRNKSFRDRVRPVYPVAEAITLKPKSQAGTSATQALLSEAG